jgi:hypothetical protein
MKEISFGANYVPSSNWYFEWGQDLERHKDDFSALKEIGIQHLRLQLRWDLFQPEPDRIDAIYIERLNKVLDLAQDTGLEIEIAALTGWLSGLWFLPEYAQKGNIFTDSHIIQGELFFLKELSAFCQHPAFYGLDIGNEINMYAYYNASKSGFNQKEGDNWLKTIQSFCSEHYQNKSVVIGCDHQPWFEDKFFSRQNLASFGTALALHTWSEFTGATKYQGGAFSQQSLRLGEFCAFLAEAYSPELDKKINIQEFGISKLWLAQGQDIEEFVLRFIKNTLRCPQVNRITFWCSHDIDQKYEYFNELEYELGLFTIQNKLKPVGKAYQKAISLYKNIKNEQTEKTAILLDDSYKRSDKNFGWYFGDKFFKLKEQGDEHICFINQDNAQNNQYLKAKNITKIIQHGRFYERQF